MYIISFRSLLNDRFRVSFSQVYENGPDKASEQILHCIEKQALVQTIINEFAKHLVPEEYDCVSEPLLDFMNLFRTFALLVLIIMMHAEYFHLSHTFSKYVICTLFLSTAAGKITGRFEWVFR